MGLKRGSLVLPETPQQNGVSKRKNRTLIEEARTMLVDSVLPTTYWAEAVSTACYVQNRVLVTKPHNKTPYELLHGRPPSISFMRPFGCPMTILNTLDTLGKFDGKTDEGPKSSKDAVADDAGKKTNEEPANEDSTVSPSISTTGQSFTNADDLPTDHLIHDLEDTADLLNTGIFSSAYDDKDVGAEADLNNLETTMNVMQRDDGIFISQDKYVADILKKFDFSTIKTASTPIETNKALLKDVIKIHTDQNVADLLTKAFDAEKGITDFSLMAYTSQGSLSSSSSDFEVHTCSKDCYQMGLESLEAKIVVHEKNEAINEEDIAFLKNDVQVKYISNKDLKNQLEEALKEKDDLKLKLENFEESSKNLTKLINSQIKSDVDDSPVNDRFKTGEGFHVVPPPYTGNYSPPDLLILFWLEILSIRLKRKGLDKENVSKQGRKSDKTKPMDTLNTASINGSVAGPSISTTGDIFEDEMTTIAYTLVAIKSERPRTTSVVIRNVEEEPRRATPVPTVQSEDKGKGKMVEPEPTPKNPRKAQIQREQGWMLMKTIAQDEVLCLPQRAAEKIFIRNRPLTRNSTQKPDDYLSETHGQHWINDFVPMSDDIGKKDDSSSKANIKYKKNQRVEHDEESVKKQKLQDDAEKEELRAFDWKTHMLTENIMYYQIIRADGSSKNYKIFSEMLDDFDRQDVMDLHRLVEERGGLLGIKAFYNLMLLVQVCATAAED
ncbi:ribonuclease H-like domain-containing protein [Tanacetum coccineum]